MSDYWQKKPLLIKSAFPSFHDPIDEHELAGLAQEPCIDARIVRSNHGKNWSVDHGPFEDFSKHCTDDWSLLVQNVDRYQLNAAKLMDAFDHIPRWRMDDLMVSFSVPNGSVGCHLDRYDVFICQGKGQRHWRIYPLDSTLPVIQPCGLSQAKPTQSPLIDVVMEAGDVLYIPPGYPHHGVALTACLNYSVGFRAPAKSHLLDAVAEQFETEGSKTDTLYSDIPLNSFDSGYELSDNTVMALQSFITSSLHTLSFEHAMLRYLSKKHIDEELLHTIIQENAEFSLEQDGMLGTVLVRTGGITPLYRLLSDCRHCWYVQGEEIYCELFNCQEVKRFLSSTKYTIDSSISSWPGQLKAIVSISLNNGWWQLAVDDESE